MCVEDPFEIGLTEYVDTLLKLGKEDKLNWTILYQSFTHKEYSQLPIEEGQGEKAWEIYFKICISQLHKVMARQAIFLCSEEISLLIKQVDMNNLRLQDAREKPLASYQPEELQQKYVFSILEVFMNTRWLNEAHSIINTNKALKSQLALNKTFCMKTPKGQKDSLFQNPIQILNALMCQLYGERYTTILQLEWVPIMDEMVSQRSIYNWSAIISSSLNQVIKKSMVTDD